MFRVAPCSRSYGLCNSYTSRFSYISSPSIQRSFACHLPIRQEFHKEKTLRPLSARKVELQPAPNTNKIDDEVNIDKFSEEIIQKLKKRGLTTDSAAFTGPVPDGLDDLLGWEKIEEERIKKNMMPERRKKIEEWAAKGDPLSQLRLENILDYETRLNFKNRKN